MATKIEWTDETWNPIRGCSRVSEGCRNCYAEKVAYRFSGQGKPYEGLVRINAAGERKPEWNGQVQFVEKHLFDPLKWGPVLTGIRNGEGVLRDKAHRDGSVTVTRERSRRIFVNSMSDLFHENVTDEMRDKIFAVMALCPQHTFQILTKRPDRMLAYLSGEGVRASIHRQAFEIVAYRTQQNVTEWSSPISLGGWPLPNVHLGVSVEDQKAADERIPLLLQTPAAVRFISAEPLLGPIKLHRLTHGDESDLNALKGQIEHLAQHQAIKPTPCSKLDWVIVGGESGHGARPMHPDWARSLRNQCETAGVPFFFKQWGEWAPTEPSASGSIKLAVAAGTKIPKYARKPDCAFGSDDLPMFRIGKKAAGHLLDGKEYHQFPGVQA